MLYFAERSKIFSFFVELYKLDRQTVYKYYWFIDQVIVMSELNEMKPIHGYLLFVVQAAPLHPSVFPV